MVWTGTPGSGNLTLDGILTVPDGSAAAPSLHGTTSATDGLFFGSGFVAFAISGAEMSRINGSGITLGDVSSLSPILTISRVTADGGMIRLQAGDVAHGITDAGATNEGGRIGINGVNGGLYLQGLSEVNLGVNLWGAVTTPDTTDTSASVGAIDFIAGKKSGTSVVAMVTTENILSWRLWDGTARMIFKASGEMHLTNTTLVALDDRDDAHLARAVQRLAASDQGIALTPFDADVTYDLQDAVEAGVLSSRGDFIRVQGAFGLLFGAAWQGYVRDRVLGAIQAEMIEAMEEVTPGLKARIAAKMAAHNLSPAME